MDRQVAKARARFDHRRGKLSRPATAARLHAAGVAGYVIECAHFIYVGERRSAEIVEEALAALR